MNQPIYTYGHWRRGAIEKQGDFGEYLPTAYANGDARQSHAVVLPGLIDLFEGAFNWFG